MGLIFWTGAIATVAGMGKMAEANDKKELANYLINTSNQLYEGKQAEVETLVDTVKENIRELDRKELEIMNSFGTFSDAMEKIQKRPQFKQMLHKVIDFPELTIQELKSTAEGANGILNGMGTGIGGMALGVTVLGSVPLGIGLLIGGFFYNKSATKKLESAYKVVEKSSEAQDSLSDICHYLEELQYVTDIYIAAILEIQQTYNHSLKQMKKIVSEKTKWRQFTQSEKTIVQNTVLLVGILYKMCQTSLVSQNEDKINCVEEEKVKNVIEESKNAVKMGVNVIDTDKEKEVVYGKKEKIKTNTANVKTYHELQKLNTQLYENAEMLMVFVSTFIESDLFSSEYRLKSRCKSVAEAEMKKQYSQVERKLDNSYSDSLVGEATTKIKKQIQNYIENYLSNVKKLNLPQEYQNKIEKILDIDTLMSVVKSELKDVLDNEVPKKVGTLQKYISRIQYSNAFDGWEFILPYELSEDFMYMGDKFNSAAEKCVQRVFKEQICYKLDAVADELQAMR